MWELTKNALNKYRNDIIRRARANLKRQKINASGNLSKTLKATKLTGEDGKYNFEITQDGEKYFQYIDEGVSGVVKKYKTRFSYKDKMPPPSKLDKWIVKRGIAGRDEKGRFVNRKSLQFAIARSIYKNGIKPTYFLSKAVEDSRIKMMPIIREAMALDIENNLK